MNSKTRKTLIICTAAILAAVLDPYKNYIDKDLIDESFYAKSTESPQIIPLKNK